MTLSSHRPLVAASSSLSVYHLPQPRCETSGPTLPIEDTVSLTLPPPLLSPLVETRRSSSFTVSTWISGNGGAWMISWISLETTGVKWVSLVGLWWFLRRRWEVRHRERRKRVKTMREPTRIPMTTQRRRPKIDVFLESCVSMNAASYTDMMMMMMISYDVFLFLFLRLFVFVFR